MKEWQKYLIYAATAVALGYVLAYSTRKSIERQYFKAISDFSEESLRFIKSLTEPDKIDLEIIIKEKNPYLKEV